MTSTSSPRRRSALARRSSLSSATPISTPAYRTTVAPSQDQSPNGSHVVSARNSEESPHLSFSSLGPGSSLAAPQPFRDRFAEGSHPDVWRPQRHSRGSVNYDGSQDTLCDDDFRRPSDSDDMSQFSLSSYRHPYDIFPPSNAYTGQNIPPVQEKRRRSVRFADDPKEDEDDVHDHEFEEEGAEWSKEKSPPHARTEGRRERRGANVVSGPQSLRNFCSVFQDENLLDPDDPSITGIRKDSVRDIVRDEKERIRLMSYRERRKYMQRARIQYNVTTIVNRQTFLLVLGKALVKFAAPSHRLESQLLAAARILEVDLETVYLPTAIIASFGGQDGEPTSEVHVLGRKGQLALGALHRVHQIYRAVVHDEISAKEATQQLKDLLEQKPVYGRYLRLAFSFFLAALICPLAFGGSFVDMWLAGAGSFTLAFVQTTISAKADTIYANVYDTTVTILISFVSRGLSSIRSQIFCYSAISSSAIVGILPGFLVLCSALELGSKNLVCGSVNLVYALIVTLFIAFGLQIGSDLFLLFDRSAHTELTTLAARAASVVTITGIYNADATLGATNGTNLLSGAFTFTNSTPITLDDIISGCYRPDSFPWYLQPFPWWTQFIIVPLFALLVSLANMQPFWTLDLLVMVVISCVGYTANKLASHFIFNHSDIVSAIGASAIGLLGNIYSRKLGGTAFTVMVPGVLFLVPSGLSQAGGINSSGEGIDTGYAMVEVVVGIVVGLFISQAIVYLFGNRKNAASFTF